MPATGTVRVPILVGPNPRTPPLATDPLYNSSELMIEARPSDYTIEPDKTHIDIAIGARTATFTVMYIVKNRDRQEDAGFITVIPAIDAPPVAVTDEYHNVRPGQVLTMDVLANDKHAPHTRLSLVHAWTADGTVHASGSSLVFKNSLTFAGTASVVYEIFDGHTTAAGLAIADVTGNSRPQLTPISISVDPNDSTPPLDLTAPSITVDDRGDRHTYSYDTHALPAGVKCDCKSDGTIIVSAAASAKKGSQGVIRVTATDQFGATSLPAWLPVIVNSPLPPTVNDFAIGPYRQSQLNSAITIDPITAHSYAHVKGGLTLVSARSLDGTPPTTLQTAGNKLSYRPAASFFGQQHISFTVKDATQAVSTGVITVTVYGNPTAPGAPHLVCPTGVGATCQGGKFAIDATTNKLYVLLTWTPATARGSPIASYNIKWTGHSTGSISCQNAATGCAIYDRLEATPAPGYTFQVQAVDLAGDTSLPPWSPGSNSGQLDVPPNPPKSVTVDLPSGAGLAGRALLVTWVPSKQRGTPTTAYVGHCTGADNVPHPFQVGPALASDVVTGLSQGTQYSCGVATRNETENSPLTPATVIHDRPIGLPNNVQQINTAAFDTYQAFGHEYDISWPQTASYSPTGESGGDAASDLQYTLSWTVNGGQPGTSGPLPLGVRDYPHVPAVENATYTLTLAVSNAYTRAARLAPVASPGVAFYSLGYPTSEPTFSPNGPQPAFQAADFTIGNNVSPSPHPNVQLIYKLYDGNNPNPVATEPAGSGSLGLPVGAHTLSVDACYRFNSTDFCASDPNNPKPQTKPTINVYVAGSASPPSNLSTPANVQAASTTLTWTWNRPSDDGCNGCGIAHYYVSFNGQAWTQDDGTQYQPPPVGPGSYSIRVVALNNAAGGVPDYTNGVASSGTTTVTNPPPPPTFTVSAGAAAPASICQGDPACRWWNFSETGIPVGSYTLQCFDNVGGNYGVSYTINITSSSWSFNGSGSRGYCGNAYHGRTVWATLGSYRSSYYVWP
jgi:archaellin